jgi:hypothetical protein
MMGTWSINEQVFEAGKLGGSKEFIWSNRARRGGWEVIVRFLPRPVFPLCPTRFRENIVGYRQSSHSNSCATATDWILMVLQSGMSSGSNISASLEKCLCLRENESLLMFELSWGFKKLSSRFLSIVNASCSGSITKGGTFHQGYFISSALPWLIKDKRRFPRKNFDAAFLLHMDNSACHNSQKTTGRPTSTGIRRAPCPLNSPDLSPCNFWLFGFLRESMKGVGLTTEDDIVEIITTIWRGVIVETLQSVFQEWMRAFIWVIDKNGQYYLEYIILILSRIGLDSKSTGHEDILDPRFLSLLA